MQTTDRLSYRRVTLEDAPFLLNLLTSPGWLKYIGDRGVYNEEDAREYITAKIFPAYETPGCGPMLAIRKSDDAILGNVGTYDRPGVDGADFGFAFLPQYHGQGYAYEASKAGLAYAQEHGFEELLAITLPVNEPSLKLLTRLGFVREPDLIRLSEDDEELVLLRLSV
jgi:ribosomal-protein-alanine N-acetyltransferase